MRTRLPPPANRATCSRVGPGARLWVAGFLGLCLAILISGAPSALHLALTHHQWCPLHHQLEHTEQIVEGTDPPANPQPGGPVVTQRPQADPDPEHEGCTVLFCTPSALLVAIAIAIEPPADQPLALMLPDSFPLIGNAPLSFAPKRSPPLP